jgi:hypothetical protein
MCLSKLDKIGSTGGIKIYSEDFEAVPSDFLAYVDFVTTEINKKYLGDVDFNYVEVHFVARPYSPSDPSLIVAGTLYQTRPWPWSKKISIIEISLKDAGGLFWASAELTPFAHELILHWLSKEYYKNYNHTDASLQLLMDQINKKWKASK